MNKIEYREKNKEKMKEHKKEYYEKNKEQIKEQKIEYRENNKDKIKAQNKIYCEKNKAKIKEYAKIYGQTEAGKKSSRISKWKHRGVICDDWDNLYERYVKCCICEDCGKDGIEGKNKHLDHEHLTGLFRNVLCLSCNIKRGFKDKLK
tara:strand:- start:32 stop:475 length:444 start_codon:yes stop_codon:yes gene_type:complete